MIGLVKITQALPEGLSVEILDDQGASVPVNQLFEDAEHLVQLTSNPGLIDTNGEFLFYAKTGWYQLELGGKGTAVDLTWNGGAAKMLPLTWCPEGWAASGVLYVEPFWKDEQIALTGINPVGPATAPTADPDGEGWLFAGASTDNVAVLGRQINHDCVQGVVTIGPHVHWRKTTAQAGNVTWRLEVKSAPVGGDFGAYVQLAEVSLPIAATVDNNTVARHLITSFGDYELTVGLSTKVYFKLTRVASNIGTDTYPGNALAMSFDYHYPVDAPGSVSEYSKF